MLGKMFRLKEHHTDIKTEVVAGITTFVTLSYIIFVQPTVLSACGMDFGAVLVATCVASAIATFLMGFYANYPVALAPGMGQNFFFAYTVVLQMGIPWQKALGAVFISGALFLLLSFFGFREKLIDGIPDSLKEAIAVGIGLFVAMIGFQWSGIIVGSSGTLVSLGSLHSAPVLLSLFGLLLTVTLVSLRVRGALLWGILATALAGLPFGVVHFHGIMGKVPSLAPTFLKLDISGAFNLGLVSVVFVFFFLALFDSIGTLIGVSSQAGLLENGKLPRAKQALAADAFGSVSGALLGTSTVTAYVESAAGVSEGGRTGLANMVTGVLMLASLFLYPLSRMAGDGLKLSSGFQIYPVVAPALIVVGSMMLRNVRRIRWDDPTESIPAFLTMVVMPFAFSITEGIAFGFISYVILKLVAGRGREVHGLVYLFAVLFVVRYIFLQ
ncbi:MAG TPA: NCS2 family permease [Acidobacteriota bacterium]|nr:NCS2 family permease [Acidobacteriota bacterium]